MKTRAKTPAGVLRAAARVIRRDGWRQNSYGSVGAPVCILGSLNFVITGDPGAEPGKFSDRFDGLAPEDDRYQPAYDLIRKRIEMTGRWDDPVNFNDDRGRTVDEVLAILDPH